MNYCDGVGQKGLVDCDPENGQCEICYMADLEEENEKLKAENESLLREREGKVLCDLELFKTLRDSANTEADEHRQCMATYRPQRQEYLDLVVICCDELIESAEKGEKP